MPSAPFHAFPRLSAHLFSLPQPADLVRRRMFHLGFVFRVFRGFLYPGSGTISAPLLAPSSREPVDYQ